MCIPSLAGKYTTDKVPSEFTSDYSDMEILVQGWEKRFRVWQG